MPITVTTNSHVDRAVQFFNNYTATNIWIGIGNPTGNAWTNPYTDSSPPTPAPSLTTLDNPIGYKQIDSISLVYPSSSGTILYQGQNWATSTVANAYTNQAFYVYITGSLNYSELPTGVTFREVGLFVNLALNSGVSATAVTPNQVSSVGELILADFRGPTIRQSDQREVISYILSF